MAFLPPASLVSKYGLPKFLGMKVLVKGPDAALAPDPVDGLALDPVLLPQADRIRPAVTASAIPPARLVRKFIVLPLLCSDADRRLRRAGALSGTPGSDVGDPRQDTR